MIYVHNLPVFYLACKSLDDNGEEVLLNEQEIRDKLIWKVASTCLGELVVASLAAGTACCFMATTAIPTVMMSLITVIALTTLFHCTEALLDYSLCCDILRDGNLDNTSFLLLKCNAILDLHHLRAWFFAVSNGYTHGTLIHEMGHAFMVRLLFKNENPIIELFPEGGGVTTFYGTALSRVGQWLGEKRALMAVTAAGAAFATLEATVLLAFAHKVKDTHPELRLHLVYMAIARVINHVFYALSALSLTSLDPKSEGHDFFMLWKGAGIHPIAAAVTMVAIPLIAQYALWKWAGDQEQAELKELNV